MGSYLALLVWCWTLMQRWHLWIMIQQTNSFIDWQIYDLHWTQEFVVTHLGDRFDEGVGGEVMSCGTEDVLTCHVIVLHHAFTQVTALAHFDEFVQHRGLERFVKSVGQSIIRLKPYLSVSLITIVRFLIAYLIGILSGNRTYLTTAATKMPWQIRNGSTSGLMTTATRNPSTFMVNSTSNLAHSKNASQIAPDPASNPYGTFVIWVGVFGQAGPRPRC